MDRIIAVSSSLALSLVLIAGTAWAQDSSSSPKQATTPGLPAAQKADKIPGGSFPQAAGTQNYSFSSQSSSRFGGDRFGGDRFGGDRFGVQR